MTKQQRIELLTEKVEHLKGCDSFDAHHKDEGSFFQLGGEGCPKWENEMIDQMKVIAIKAHQNEIERLKSELKRINSEKHD